MFRFKFVMDLFQSGSWYGPICVQNMRAKWLTLLCPDDLEVAFAPDQGQVPLYSPERVKLVPKEEQGWWNHYIYNYKPHFTQNTNKGRFWSLGPNIDLSLPKPQPDVPLVVCSQTFKQHVIDSWGHPSDRITVIPNMVDPTLFSPGERGQHVTVGWVGYDTDEAQIKGAEVIPYLARRFPDIRFEMIFAAPPRYPERYRRDDLPNLRLFISVRHDQMPGLIRRWHVLVSGSKYETGATHILEAMACGVPVIAATYGAIPEVASSQYLLPDMRCTFEPPRYTYTPESLERFAQALEQLLGDRKLYQEKADAALAESKKHAPQVIAAKWFDFMYQCRELSRS
ncbi:MAG: glycosyltransferase family 4 protein [Brevibacillus sp.]|nr:glycosyltransferase family 4 protein [Brevibacillus sp.]